MSYSFDATMNALKPDNSGQTNIFAGDQAGGQAATGAQTPGQSQNMPTSAQAGGDMPTSGSTGSAPQVSQQQSSQNQAQSGARNSIFQQNAGRQTAPTDVAGTTNSINDAKSKLQNEANNYVSSAGNLYGGGKLDSGTQSAIGEFTKTGNAPAAGATPSWMQLFQGGPTKVDAFKPTTDTSTGNANLLSTNAGIGQLFRQSNSPEYSAGQAALDTQLLTANPGFAQQRQAALDAASSLQAEKDKLATDTTGQAQAARDQAMASYKDAIKSQLQGSAQSYQDAGTAAKTAFDKQVSGLQTPDAQKEAALKAYNDLNTASLTNPNMPREEMQFLTPNNVDYGKYFAANPAYQKTSWQDFTGAPQAHAYNAIESALGAGGAPVPEAGGQYVGKTPAFADVMNFNKGAYQNELTANANRSYQAFQKANADKAAQAAAWQQQMDASHGPDVPLPGGSGTSVPWTSQAAANVGGYVGPRVGAVGAPAQKAVDYVNDPRNFRM